MKFLILRFSSIGDIVLTTPVVRCLKKKFPDAEIHYATKTAFQSIVLNNPYLTKIHLMGDSLLTLIRELRKEKFDYIIDLHSNQRTFLLKFLSGVKSFSFNKINFEKWLMVNFKINRLPDEHIVDRYLETVQSFHVENDHEGLDYFLSKEDELDLKTLPTPFQHRYIAWVVGAKRSTKKFPPEKIITTINYLNSLNLPIVFLGGKEDFELGEFITTNNKQQTINLFNACNMFSLNQSASLIKQSKVVVTNDTGLMHIAAAFKKPIISLWGNTVPEFGMSPYYGKFQIPHSKFQIPNLPCRPCSKLGYSTCPKGHFKCMKLLDEIQIAEAIRCQMVSS